MFVIEMSAGARVDLLSLKYDTFYFTGIYFSLYLVPTAEKLLIELVFILFSLTRSRFSFMYLFFSFRSPYILKTAPLSMLEIDFRYYDCSFSLFSVKGDSTCSSEINFT